MLRSIIEIYEVETGRVREILDAGAKRANVAAEATMQVVRGAMNLSATGGAP